MHPILLKLGPLNIYSYGVMVAAGFSIAVFLIYKHAADFRIEKEKIMDLAVLILISGLIGARSLYVILNLGYYKANPLEILDLSKGGLAWHGAFLLGLGCAVIYMRKNKMNFWITMDLAAPYIALAQGFGRIGCFLNGCCYGIDAPSGYLFGVTFPSNPILRHPVQLYSASLLFAIFALLRIWQKIPHFRGGVFLGYCMLYSLKRFAVEFMRDDNPHLLFSLTLSQVISMLIFAVALAVFFYKDSEWKRYLRSR